MGTSFASLFKHGTHDQKDHGNWATERLAEIALWRLDEFSETEMREFEEWIGPEGSGLFQSIQAEGVRDPVTVRMGKDRPYVEDGNHRIAIAQMLGIKNLPVRFRDDVPEEVRKHGNGSHNEKDHNPHKYGTRPAAQVLLDRIRDREEADSQPEPRSVQERLGDFDADAFETWVLPECRDILSAYPALGFRSPEGLADSVAETHMALLAGAGFATDDIERLEAYALVTAYRPAILDALIDRVETLSTLMQYQGVNWVSALVASDIKKHAQHNQLDHGNRYPRNVSIFEDTSTKTFHLVGHETSSAKRGRESTLCGLNTTRFRKAAPFPSGDPRAAVHYERGCTDCIDIMTNLTELEKHMGPGDHPGGTPQTTHGSGAYGTSGTKMKQRVGPGGDLSDGFTILPITGEPATSGFAVALKGNEKRIAGDKITPNIIAAFRREAWDLFSDIEGTHWGGWYDSRNDVYVFDVSVVLDNAEEAVRLGRENGQDAIWDLANEEEIRTDDDGTSFEEWKARHP